MPLHSPRCVSADVEVTFPPSVSDSNRAPDNNSFYHWLISQLFSLLISYLVQRLSRAGSGPPFDGSGLHPDSLAKDEKGVDCCCLRCLWSIPCRFSYSLTFITSVFVVVEVEEIHKSFTRKTASVMCFMFQYCYKHTTHEALCVCESWKNKCFWKYWLKLWACCETNTWTGVFFLYT